MAQKTISIGTVNLVSVWGAKSRKAIEDVEYRTPNVVGAIPRGSSINSAWLYMSVTKDYRGEIYTVNDRVYGEAMDFTSHVQSAFNSGSNPTFKFRWLATVTNYPYAGSVNLLFENIRLVIDYTIPYSSCTPPTEVSISAETAELGASVTLSWSGASGGNNNGIASYDVYRSTDRNANYEKIANTSETSISVDAPAENGATYYYKVLSVGSVSGYSSGLSSAYAELTCSYSAPIVSDVRLDTFVNNIYARAGTVIVLSWAADNGENNAISSFSIYRNGALFQSGVTGSSIKVNSHPTAGSSYYYSVQALAPYENSAIVNSPTVYSYVACSAPTTISVSRDNVAPNEEVLLSWSGAEGGSYYNIITGYDVLRQYGSESYSVLKSIKSEETSGSTNVNARSGNGETYHYKVITKGDKQDSEPSGVTASLTCSFSAPVLSNVRLSKAFAASGEHIILSWSAANGTNNPVKSITVYRDGAVYQTGVSGSSLAVPCNEKEGEQYEYSLQVIGTYEDSAVISAGIVKTYGNPTAPASASVTPKSVDVSTPALLRWSGHLDGALNPIQSFDVYRRIPPNGEFSFLQSVKVSDASNGISVTAPSQMGISYEYKIQSVGLYSSSNLSDVSASLASTVYTVPTPPSSVSISTEIADAGTNVLLSWSGALAGTNNPITGYQVYRSTRADGGFAVIGETDAKSLSFSVAAHQEMGKRYYFRVATKGKKEGFATSALSSGSVSVVSRVYTAVTSPTNIRTAAALVNPNTPIAIAWDAGNGGTNTTVIGYEIWRSINNGAYDLFRSVSASALSASDTSGASGTIYSYKIKSVASRKGYDSGFSSVVTVVSNTPPTAPASISVTPTLYEDGDIKITFPPSSDVDNNLSHYQIQRRIQTVASGWGSWTNLVTNLSGTSYTDKPSVERGCCCQYQVKAHDGLGLYSPYTVSVQIKRNELPATPAILQPSAGKTTYNRRPIFLVRIAPEPNGTPQDVEMSIDGGNYITVASVPHNGAVIPVQSPVSVAFGKHVIKFRASDTLGAKSVAASVSVIVKNPSYARELVRGCVIADLSISHQSEIKQLYDQVNDLRSYYGLSTIAVPPSVGNYANVSRGNIGMFSAWGNQMKALQQSLADTWAVSRLPAIEWLPCLAGMYPIAAAVEQVRREIQRG